jgi:hypothetical protein
LKALIVGLAFAAVLLSGCYASRMLLLDPTEAAHPLDDGVYVRASGDQLRVSLEPDGWYQVEQIGADGLIGESHRALFNAVTLDGGRPGYAIAEDSDDGFIYAVGYVERERVYLATPDCADPLDRNAAVDHGGFADDDDDMAHNCFFKNRGALISALTAFAGQAGFGSPYQRK